MATQLLKPIELLTAGVNFESAQPHDFLPPSEGRSALSVGRAWAQYKAAKGVWASVRAGKLRIRDVADAAGEKYETQRRKLRGLEPAAVADLVLWRLLGAQQTSEEGVHGIFPPAYADALGSWQPGDGVPRLVTRPSPAIEWPKILAAVRLRAEEMNRQGLASVLDSGVLAVDAAHALAMQSQRGSQIRRSPTEPDVVYLGTPPEVALGLGFLHESYLREPQESTAARDGLLNVLQRLATTSEPHRFMICVAVGPRGQALLEAVIPRIAISASGTALQLGPYDSGGGEKWRDSLLEVVVLEKLRDADDYLTASLLQIGKMVRL